MNNVSTKSLWRTLEADATYALSRPANDLFVQEANRSENFLKVFDQTFLVDFSRQNISADTLRHLLQLCSLQGVQDAAHRMVAGKEVNTTEKRPALHVHMREPAYQTTPDFQKMYRLVENVSRDTSIRHIISIGIGGSSLGPELTANALKPYWQINTHGQAFPKRSLDFISNIDSSAFADAIEGKRPEDTLFIIASKSFKTQETMQNMQSALTWMHTAKGIEASKRFIAVTANPKEASTYDILEEHILGFPQGVGGRYSLWSTIGLPIAIMIGMQHFANLLAGAHAMDQHFVNTQPQDNIACWLGALAVWNHTFLGCQSHVVCPYVHRLSRLPAYLQQLEMESLGKSVDLDGNPITHPVSPVIWGEPGTDAQHSFFQHLHQGQRTVSLDFIASATDDVEKNGHNHHDALLANCFAQSAALMHGRTASQTHEKQIVEPAIIPWCTFPGNRPSTTILYRKLTPYTLGALLALYEHKVFVQSVLWRINPFDQFGVEYGKTVAQNVLRAIRTPKEANTLVDSTTQTLIRYVKNWQTG